MAVHVVVIVGSRRIGVLAVVAAVAGPAVPQNDLGVDI